MNEHFLETLAYERIAEARAEAARLRLFHAAPQASRQHPRRGFVNFLRPLRCLLFALRNRSGGQVAAHLAPDAVRAMGLSTDVGASGSM